MVKELTLRLPNAWNIGSTFIFYYFKRFFIAILIYCTVVGFYVAYFLNFAVLEIFMHYNTVLCLY